jgi:trehalose 6-phosphate phosphatase
LRAFNEEVRDIVGPQAGLEIETKPGSTSLHFRARPELADEAWAHVEPVAARHRLEARRGRMVVEVRPPRAGKGKALARLVAELQPDAVIFAGDDEGDREAFAYLKPLELPRLAIGVASREASSDLFADCDQVLEGPRAFSRWLTALADWADRQGRARPATGA